jgi:hypothetical protein
MSNTAMMTAAGLFETTEMALAIAGLPRFSSADSDGEEDLKFVPATGPEEDDCWALVPVESEADEFVAVDTEMARYVLSTHFREWLLARGYQVQVHCYNQLQRWTLLDCLSPADGGGDRLDVDYPYGDDQLAVLVQSVVAVNTIA